LAFLLYAYATMHGQTHIKFTYQVILEVIFEILSEPLSLFLTFPDICKM